MNGERLSHIFAEIISPELTERAQRSEHPITVFLGGQPGAGKTKGQQRVVEMYPQRELLPIIGDDFRQHHPEYEYLIENEPFRMPDETAYAAGRWTGMAVDYAKRNGISCIIEGTWRNLDTVLDEAKADRSRNRGTHAVIVAVPPLLSRIGTLGRFYFQMDETGVARWTPPEAHENTVRALDANVPRIARSGLMNRLTVLDGNGNIHYDGTNPEQFVETWEGQFKRDLTDEERTAAHNRIELLEDLAYQYSPDSRTVFEMLDKLTKDVEFYSGGTPASFDGVKTTGSVYVKGTYPRRAACQRILEAQVKQLQALRKRSGLSQCELAERMGLSTARVSHIESSSPLDLKPDTLNRYVDALGLDLLIAVRTRDGKLIRLDEN